LCRRAWQGFKKTIGPDHIMTLYSVRHLAMLYTAEHKLGEAEQLHQRVLEGIERKFDPKHRLTLNIVSDLAFITYFSGSHIRHRRCSSELGSDLRRSSALTMNPP